MNEQPPLSSDEQFDARTQQAARQSVEDGQIQHTPVKRIMGVGLVVGTALAIPIGVGVAGIAGEHGGSTNGAEEGKVDNSIYEVTLNPGANVRFDPYVGEGENNNEAIHLDSQVKIDAAHDIRVLSDTKNGTWYGIPMDEIKDLAPSIDTADKDSIVWVNEQGATVKTTDETQLPPQ